MTKFDHKPSTAFWRLGRNVPSLEYVLLRHLFDVCNDLRCGSGAASEALAVEARDLIPHGLRPLMRQLFGSC